MMIYKMDVYVVELSFIVHLNLNKTNLYLQHVSCSSLHFYLQTNIIENRYNRIKSNVIGVVFLFFYCTVLMY